MSERETAIPYYVQVAETMRRRILTREYPEGSRIPPAQDLEKEFGVSNITIRKALETLTQDRILQRKRGVGTVVPKFERDVVTFEVNGSFHRLVGGVEKLPLEMEVLEIAVTPCPDHVQHMIGVERGTQVWRMRKVRKHNGHPICYYIHYSHQALCGKVTKEAAEQETFVHVFQKASEMELVSLEQRLEAAIADLDLVDALGVRFGAPLLFIENLYFTAEHKPVVLTQIYYRGDRCSYKAKTDLNANTGG